MNSFVAFLAVAMVTLAVAEPPSPYAYNRPSGGGQFIGGGGVGGGVSGGVSFNSGGGGGGFDSSEGANVDPQLLQQVRQILLQEEAQASSRGGPSSVYGAPVYGPPAARVVDVHLEHTVPAIQVAAFDTAAQTYSVPSHSGY